MASSHNLYIHVPFCASKCNYCAFHSVACRPDWDAYAALAINEIKYWSTKLGKTTVPTIFFGGGTPSLMPTQIFLQIMDAISANFDIAANTEITLESNPGTLDMARLCEFVAAGVNRLSIGVQSLDDNALKFLGRRHNAAVADELIRTAHDMKLRVSGDFIYGLPGQTVADIEQMCRGILDLGLQHASIYELSIEPETPFAQQKIQTPANETVAEMYQVIGNILADALPRYEISNYAAPGYECRHNQNIWDGQPYIGIGPTACGRVFADGQWLETRVTENGELKSELMDAQTRAVEKVMTGMRTLRGVLLTPDVRDVIDWEFVENNRQYFHIDDSRIRATNKTLLILDAMLIKLIK